MTILTIFQIVIAVLLVVTIILQQRGDHRSAGSFGTASASYRSKKGVEQFLFYSTIFLAAIFASVSILAVLI